MNVVLAGTELGAVLELAAGGAALVSAAAARVIALLDRSEGRPDVFEFVVDVERDFGEADDQSEHDDRRDEHEFGGNNEAIFVVEQCAEARHRGDLSGVVG